ncbi:Ctr copper transporter family-domain-containing protein [Crucibulum laeve]|uniref:Copper transport protein n=1 Tax=Crucibulum laeve TaxID=68775 RepID=A0A5C3MII1_9AGAR|nr:Ctr copper transporter family-domain-containing protein [Crucibulum laeve]
MDHGGHGGHGGHDMPMAPKCSMDMLWNTNVIDTCIVFRSWHISSRTAFVFSCLAIVLLGIFFEYLRAFQKRVDVHIAASLSEKGKGRARSGRSTPEEEEDGLLSGRRLLRTSLTGTPVPPISRAVRAILYGATVFLSFFLMLVFMTYNAYLILSVVLGATLGHYIFGATINVDALLSDSASGKGMACH